MAVVGKHEPTEKDRSFFEKARQLGEEAQPIPWYKSIPAAAGKGFLKGIIGLGEMVSGQSGKDPQAEEDRETILDKWLPSNQGLGENIAHRTGEIAPSVAAGGSNLLGTALRSLGAGASSQLVKEVGGGETAQALAEIPALLAPDAAKLIPTKAGSNQRKLAEFARSKGIPEEDLALMLGEQGAVKESISSFAPKGGRTKRSFDSAKESLNDLWSYVKGSPEAQTQLSKPQIQDMLRGLAGDIKNMPAEQRDRILKDSMDLLKSPMRGEDVINFWQDLNYYIKKDEKGLGVLKEHLSKALTDVSPQLGEDFKNLNQLYGNYSRLHQQMKPSLVDQFYRMGELGALAYGVISMDVPTLAKTLGPVAARELARQAITNPRLQNLSQRFVNAAQRSSPAVAKIAYDQFILEVAKEDAETAAKLSEFDTESFARSLSADNNKKDKAN